MQLIVSRLTEFHHGLMVSLKDGDEIKNIGIINGNKNDFFGPILLFSLDQDVVYGLSHRQVVSRIYNRGAQILLTTKELGHKLYEHGMKAALGKVKVGNIHFSTNLDTFYSQKSTYGPFNLVVSDGRLGCTVKPFANYEPILLATAGFDCSKLNLKNRIDVDKVQTQVTKKFQIGE